MWEPPDTISECWSYLNRRNYTIHMCRSQNECGLYLSRNEFNNSGVFPFQMGTFTMEVMDDNDYLYRARIACNLVHYMEEYYITWRNTKINL